MSSSQLSMMNKLDVVHLRNEEDGLEFQLTLNGEVLDSKVILPVIGQALVERGIHQ